MYALPGLPTIFYGDEVGLEGYEDPINRRPFPWNNMDNQLLEHYKGLGKLRAKYKKAFSGTIIRKSADNTQNIHFIYNNSEDKKQILAKNCVNCVTNKAMDGEISLKVGDFAVLKYKNV